MLETFLTQSIPNAIASGGMLTLLLVFIGGIVTSISPCILSMLPVVVGYIGGYSAPSKKKGFILSSFFVLGLGVTFAILGISAAMLGKIFGQIGDLWYYLLAVMAILMGLQLLEVINIKMPGLKTMPIKGGGIAGAFLVGLFFGLVASPCATPILGVIMAYVASKGQLAYGGLLLFVYGLGHGLPLILVGTFTALVKELPKMQVLSKYINYVSGTILVGLGLYFLYQVSA